MAQPSQQLRAFLSTLAFSWAAAAGTACSGQVDGVPNPMESESGHEVLAGSGAASGSPSSSSGAASGGTIAPAPSSGAASSGGELQVPPSSGAPNPAMDAGLTPPPPVCNFALPDICLVCDNGETECAHYAIIDGVCTTEICPPSPVVDAGPLPAPDAAPSPPDCNGLPLPTLCEVCADGSDGCAHYVIVNDQCTIAYCDDSATADAGGNADAGGSTLTCEERDLLATGSLETIAADYPSCSNDDDCVELSDDSACHVFPCGGIFTNKLGASAAQKEVAKLNASVCAGYAADCGPFIAPPCAYPGQPVCKNGVCGSQF